MPKVVGIRFHGTGKTYHFDPGSHDLHKGDAVIVETSQGIEFGIVSDDTIELPEEKLAAPLKTILRLADADDLIRYDENTQKEKEAFQICQEKIETRDLDMHLVSVECTFDGRKIIFYFTADGRIDFRELVKDLASVFHTRIELRQIGVRDEARMIGGLGVCGRELCCRSYLTDFVPVSIKMAKAQNLSMNPAKISGACGRLMCCLKYEHAAYEDVTKRMPRRGTVVTTDEGRGTIESVNLLRETVTVRLDKGGDADLLTRPYNELVIGEGRMPKSDRPQPEQQQEKAPVKSEAVADQSEQSNKVEKKSRKRRSGRRRSGRPRKKNPETPSGDAV